MRIRLLALATGLAVLWAPALAHGVTTLEPSEQKFFMRNDATTCPGNPYLSVEAGENEPGCGYQGGAPFGELYHAGVWSSTVKTYTSTDGMPQILDASRDLTGTNRVVATATTNRMAAGQIRVDVTVKADTPAGQVVVGTHSAETIVNPTNSAQVDFPFQINIPDALDTARISNLTVEVDIRGWHVLTGYHRLSGQSSLTLPTYIEVTV